MGPSEGPVSDVSLRRVATVGTVGRITSSALTERDFRSNAEDGNGEEIEEGEVHVDEDREPEDGAEIVLRESVKAFGDANGAAHVFDADVGARTREADKRAVSGDDVAPHLRPGSDVNGFDRELAAEADAEAKDFGIGFRVDDLARRGDEFAGLFRADVGDLDRFAGGLAKVVADVSLIGDLVAVEMRDEVAGLNAGDVGGAVGLDGSDADLGGGLDADVADFFGANALGKNGDREGLAVAFDDEIDLGLIVGPAA